MNTPGFAAPTADRPLRRQQRQAQSLAGVAGAKPGGSLTACSSQLVLFLAFEPQLYTSASSFKFNFIPNPIVKPHTATDLNLKLYA